MRPPLSDRSVRLRALTRGLCRDRHHCESVDDMLRFFPPLGGPIAAAVAVFFVIVALIAWRYYAKKLCAATLVLSLLAVAYLGAGVYLSVGKPYHDAGVRYTSTGISASEITAAMQGIDDVRDLPVVEQAAFFHKADEPSDGDGARTKEYGVIVFDNDSRASVEISTFESDQKAKEFFEKNRVKQEKYLTERDKASKGYVLVGSESYDVLVLPFGYDAKKFLLGSFSGDDGMISRIYVRFGDEVVEILQSTDSYLKSPKGLELFTATESLTVPLTDAPTEPETLTES